MVWSVFAPKFAFDAAGQIIGDVGLIFGCAIMSGWNSLVKEKKPNTSFGSKDLSRRFLDGVDFLKL